MKSEVTLGIDIGGTNTAFGLVDRAGRCTVVSKIPTRGEEPAKRLFERIFSAFRNLWAEEKNRNVLRGIGIGAPNGNYFSGCVENPPNLSWDRANLVELAQQYYDVPVKITNDANAAALGEMLFGAARTMKNFIEITLGTGLGSGIVVNGQLVYGSDGNAGEMGHIIAVHEGRLCNCGRRGCLETYASASGIQRTVEEMLEKSERPSILRSLPAGSLSSREIALAAAKGDALALEAFQFTAEILGRTLADAVAVLSPEAIILFGGLAQAGDLLFEPLRKAYEENVLNIFAGKVNIIPSGLDADQAAILGAGALIWSELGVHL